MALQFTRHEVISLKQHPGFSEKWLQDTIADDPSILGLGDLELIDRERPQEHSGRLDLLLSDGDAIRYEVELMLGSTDPSHIIRCIEYWDTERRRYPGYERIAVLVAEDITTRFLNVMSLMAGNIPMIAIQLNTLKVGEQILLDFVKVLNQTSLRRDDVIDRPGPAVDRSYWDEKVGTEIMSIADGMLTLANDAGDGRFELRYVRSHVGISEPGDSKHFVVIHPKRQYAHCRIAPDDPNLWIEPFESAGLPVTKRNNRLQVTLNPQQFENHKSLLRDVIVDALGHDVNDA